TSPASSWPRPAPRRADRAVSRRPLPTQATGAATVGDAPPSGGAPPPRPHVWTRAAESDDSSVGPVDAQCGADGPHRTRSWVTAGRSVYVVIILEFTLMPNAGTMPTNAKDPRQDRLSCAVLPLHARAGRGAEGRGEAPRQHHHVRQAAPGRLPDNVR